MALSLELLVATLGLAQSVRAGAPQTCSGELELSCHNTSSVADTCCFNTPGGSMIQTQFWDADPAIGPDDSWTIHGLWPDHCDGTFDSTCDQSRAYTNISDILKSFGDDDLLSYMETFWLPNDGTGEEFWEHEWGKHGTCISTLEPDCFTDYEPTEEVSYFFNRTVSLFKSLPTYEWLSAAGITPDADKTYALSDIQAALSPNHGGETVYIGCSGDELDTVYYYFNVRGSVANGDFVPASPDGDAGNCPDDGVKYMPKASGGGGDGGGGSSPTSTTTTSAPSPTSTAPFSGQGKLNAVTGGSAEGCIISGGTWYTTGTCATFTAASSGDGFTLESSKGPCAVVDGALSCASGNDADVFTADTGRLVGADGSADWYADEVPSGSTQGTVYTSQGSHGTTLQIQWQSA
ncbi:ribonuclease T2-like protein [Xylariomycetidae sp. FL0641]|nr:ribonuclease T2-like protein [Xylariomycetidae sp. FL0641]